MSSVMQLSLMDRPEVAVTTTTSTPVTRPQPRRRANDTDSLLVDMPVPAPRNWTLTPEEREEISHSITQTWTDQAIKCYMTGAQCSICEIPKGNYSFVCQMNKVVGVLLETLGEPEPNRVRKLYPPGLVRAMQG